jgi:N,N-dimethylformamidase beta subunit-like, C-terminal
LSGDGRTITCYKESETRPESSRAKRGTDSHTARFRDPAVDDPRAGDRPEQLLFGAQFGSIPVRNFEYTPNASVPAELLAGTGLVAGASLGRIVGGETDALDPNLPVPAGQTTLATASFPDRYGLPGSAAAVFRPLPGGKALFAAGTFRWMWGLDRAYAARNGVPASFGRLTANILAAVIGR